MHGGVGDRSGRQRTVRAAKACDEVEVIARRPGRTLCRQFRRIQRAGGGKGHEVGRLDLATWQVATVRKPPIGLTRSPTGKTSGDLVVDDFLWVDFQ